MNSHSLFAFFGFVTVCFLAASSGGIFRAGSWYDALAKPWWRPPRWLFAPAWSVLYFTIALSGWLVWREAGLVLVPFCIYGISLCFNAAWSACFFGLRRMDIAFADVLLLWLSIAMTIAAFYPIETRAAFLLLPYLGWVSFAACLNFTIWRMNRAREAV